MLLLQHHSSPGGLTSEFSWMGRHEYAPPLPTETLAEQSANVWCSCAVNPQQAVLNRPRDGTSSRLQFCSTHLSVVARFVGFAEQICMTIPCLCKCTASHSWFYSMLWVFVTRVCVDSHRGCDFACVMLTLWDSVSLCTLLLNYSICHLVAIVYECVCACLVHVLHVYDTQCVFGVILALFGVKFQNYSPVLGWLVSLRKFSWNFSFLVTSVGCN